MNVHEQVNRLCSRYGRRRALPLPPHNEGEGSGGKQQSDYTERHPLAKRHLSNPPVNELVGVFLGCLVVFLDADAECEFVCYYDAVVVKREVVWMDDDGAHLCLTLRYLSEHPAEFVRVVKKQSFRPAFADLNAALVATTKFIQSAPGCIAQWRIDHQQTGPVGAHPVAELWPIEPKATKARANLRPRLFVDCAALFAYMLAGGMGRFAFRPVFSVGQKRVGDATLLAGATFSHVIISNLDSR